jgi:hypothetical protein
MAHTLCGGRGRGRRRRGTHRADVFLSSVLASDGRSLEQTANRLSLPLALSLVSLLPVFDFDLLEEVSVCERRRRGGARGGGGRGEGSGSRDGAGGSRSPSLAIYSVGCLALQLLLSSLLVSLFNFSSISAEG